MKPQTDPNMDQIIHKNFPKDIAFKRVQKEIALLSSLNKNFYKISIVNSPNGLKILIETLKAALQNFCESSQIVGIQMILFEILLEAKFPFVYPKIFCRTSFCKPSIADGRDILIDIIKKTWTPSILLHEIITLFPIFMKETLSKAKDINHLQKIGTYHLGCLYNLEDFLLMDSVDVFPVNELMPNNKTIPRYLVLSQSNLLNFEIIDKKENKMKLISWANLQSLLNIKRKKDEQFTLILTWKDAHKSEGLTQIVALEQASKFCELIIRNMKGFGVKISKNIIKQPDLTLDDVTVKAYDQIDIMDLLENITILESRLPEEFTIDIVSTLMMLYQKAVEYYSALNDPMYDDYLEKLHLLLSREDVQILLRSKAEVKNTSVDKPKEKKKIVEIEEEEEEEKKENSGSKIEDYFPKTNKMMEMSPEKLEKERKPIITKPIIEEKKEIIKPAEKQLKFESPPKKEEIKEKPKFESPPVQKEIISNVQNEIISNVSTTNNNIITLESSPQKEIVQNENLIDISSDKKEISNNNQKEEIHQEDLKNQEIKENEDQKAVENQEIKENEEKLHAENENLLDLAKNEEKPKETNQNEDLLDLEQNEENKGSEENTTQEPSKNNNNENNEKEEILDSVEASEIIKEINNNLNLNQENPPENNNP